MEQPAMFGGKVMNKLILALALASFWGCSSGGANNRQTVIATGMELSVEPGEVWQDQMKLLMLPIDKTPQMAAWIEDSQGRYVATITVTKYSSKPPNKGRPEALPVWHHKIPDDMEQIDAVTAATSKSSVGVPVDKSALINGQEYHVYLEVNHSFDYNDTWQKKSGDVNGQPSIVYHAQFIAGTAGRTNLKSIGYGSVDGTNGNIVQELMGITTALKIIKEVYITIN
jgi:hypothetical protein